MALLNKFLLNGETIKCSVIVAPADSPEIVTLLGSPPTFEIFSFIHFKDSMTSRRAKFETLSSG